MYLLREPVLDFSERQTGTCYMSTTSKIHFQEFLIILKNAYRFRPSETTFYYAKNLVKNFLVGKNTNISQQKQRKTQQNSDTV